jgi:5-methylcytosine-specific restriction endonuclease McrA
MRIRKMTIHISTLLYGLFLSMMAVNLYAIEEMPSDTLPPDTTVLSNVACMQCHEKQNSTLIKDWKISAHATTDPEVNCVSCHGQLHKNVAGKARRDEICIDCHGGKKDPVVHSYSSSKHGALMQLEKNTYEWKRRFELANYRSPGCGYCHMHQGNHDVSNSVRHDLMNGGETEMVHDNTRAVCQDCHSPRYITSLFENGEAMLEIARKKVREADALIIQAEKIFSEDELKFAKNQFEKMQYHIKNVHLGVGHQSPDYQWWHGQPALDGDLLRIKDSIGELYRLK